MKRLVFSCVAVSGLVVLLAGCSTPQTRPSALRPSAASTATRSSKATTSTVIGRPSSAHVNGGSLAGAGNQCTPGDLGPSWPGFGNGASEDPFYVVNMKNTSGRACVTGGYVGVAAYDPTGRLIPASEQRDPSIAPNDFLSVVPGASVHFSIDLPAGDDEAAGAECSTVVGALHLIPPDERAEVQVATPTSTGYPKLCGNSFLVGPLVSGAITN